LRSRRCRRRRRPEDEERDARAREDLHRAKVACRHGAGSLRRAPSGRVEAGSLWRGSMKSGVGVLSTPQRGFDAQHGEDKNCSRQGRDDDDGQRQEIAITIAG